MTKPILCLDFDGVIHSYVSGWKGTSVIPDETVPGAIVFMHSALDVFRVAVYSSRSNQDGGIVAMKKWLKFWAVVYYDNLNWLDKIEWPTEKPPALVTIDDRALTFNGDWSSYDPASLLQFKPWNKK